MMAALLFCGLNPLPPASRSQIPQRAHNLSPDGLPWCTRCRGIGYIYGGLLPFTHAAVDPQKLAEQQQSASDNATKLSLIMANPERAMGFAAMPVAGVGLARLEFIVRIRSHVAALRPPPLLRVRRAFMSFSLFI